MAATGSAILTGKRANVGEVSTSARRSFVLADERWHAAAGAEPATARARATARYCVEERVVFVMRRSPAPRTPSHMGPGENQKAASHCLRYKRPSMASAGMIGAGADRTSCVSVAACSELVMPDPIVAAPAERQPSRTRQKYTSARRTVRQCRTFVTRSRGASPPPGSVRNATVAHRSRRGRASGRQTAAEAAALRSHSERGRSG